jgi:hypothetical protein
MIKKDLLISFFVPKLSAGTKKKGPNMVKQTHKYYIAAKHDAYGIEGASVYIGTERGAKMAAKKIARAAGYGWFPIVWEI